MGFWFFLIAWAVTFVLSEIFRPKPKDTVGHPAGLGDFKFPTATEGRVVPLIWGTVKLEGPNVIWYGDFDVVPIKKKVKTGLFSSSKITVGYKYYVGMQMALCRGPNVELKRIYINDEEVIDATGIGNGNTVTINKPSLFGGDDVGNGGIVAKVRFFKGMLTQTAPAYLTQFQDVDGQTPNYKKTSYVLVEKGYVGNSTNIYPWAFEAQRFPNGLGLAEATVNDGLDANPMNVIYEAMHDTEWGLGLPAGDFDIPNWTEAAETLAEEGNGFSFVLDRPMECTEFIKEVERQIDGIVYMDRVTGKWKVKLARGGYDVNSLPELTAARIKEIENFSRGGWEETSNQVRVLFDDRANGYVEGRPALAQDMANIAIQNGNIITSDSSYPGVKNAALANTLAWRDLRALSYPLAKAKIKVDRTFWEMNPFDVFRWTDATLGITDMVFRITRMNLGELTDGVISLDVIQDVFVHDDGIFVAPPITQWTPPTPASGAIPIEDSFIIEAPRAFVDRDTNGPFGPVLDRIYAAARKVSGNLDFDIRVRPTGVGDYVNEGHVEGFLYVGSLADPLNTVAEQGQQEIEVEPDPDAIEDLYSAVIQAIASGLSAQEIGVHLKALLWIGDTPETGEFAAFKGYVDLTTSLRFRFGYRGMLDTVPLVHPAGTKVWLLWVFGGMTDSGFTPGEDYDVKLIPKTWDGETLDEGDAPVTVVPMDNRARRPNPPSELTIAGVRYNTGTVSLDTGSGLDDKGFSVGFTRRYFRAPDEVAALTDENELPDNFDAEYAVRVVDTTSGSDLLYTTAWAATNAFSVSRTKILRYAGAVPSSIRIEVRTRDQYVSGISGQPPVMYEAQRYAEWEFDVSSSLLAGDHNWGVLPVNTGSNNFNAPSTATYTLNIGTALASGNVQVSINGGAFSTVISSGNTTGTFGANSGDTIAVRHTQAGSDASETFCELVVSGSSVAFAVLTY